MDKEVSESINLALSLILTATLIGALILLFSVGSEIKDSKYRIDSLSNDLESESIMSRYSHNIVDGSDLIAMMVEYKGNFTYEIINEKPSKLDEKALVSLAEKKNNLVDADYYDIDSIVKKMESAFRKKKNIDSYFGKYTTLPTIANAMNLSGTTYGKQSSDWAQDTLRGKINTNKYLCEVVDIYGEKVVIAFSLK